MPNPYHDENGKFCSKAGMMGAVLRLQQEGRSEEATALFNKYKAATEGKGKKPAKTTTVPASSPAVENTTPSTEDDRGATVGAYDLNGKMTPQEKVEELSAFITGFGLKAGSSEDTDKAQDAFHATWEKHGAPTSSLAYYDPEKKEEAQYLYEFSGKYGNQEVLYAYKDGLYIDNVPMNDSWGYNTKFGYLTRPASPEPVMTETYTQRSFVADLSDEGKADLEAWEEGHTKRVSPRGGWGGDEMVVTGATEVSQTTEEVSYGTYEAKTVYKDEATGNLYQLTSSYDSWDNGNDESSYYWMKVEDKEVTRVGQPKFVQADPDSDTSSWD